MKRKEFYKEYYNITDHRFCNRAIWFSKDREKAWRKGQSNTSKTERKIFIVCQYLFLVLSVILLFFGRIPHGAISFILFLLMCLITDFSILKVEVLYHIFHRDTIYTTLLYQTFMGKMDFFFNSIKTNNGRISGFVRNNSNKLVAKYLVVYRKQQNKTEIIFKPTCIVVKTSVSQHRIDNPTLSEGELLEKVSELLHD